MIWVKTWLPSPFRLLNFLIAMSISKTHIAFMNWVLINDEIFNFIFNTDYADLHIYA